MKTKELIEKKVKERTEKLRKEIKERTEKLREEIKDLKREAEFKQKEFAVREKEIRIDEKEAHYNYISQADVSKVRVEELQNRLNEHPYKQLQDILKALVVKLPTLNIKEIHTHTKES